MGHGWTKYIYSPNPSMDYHGNTHQPAKSQWPASYMYNRRTPADELPPLGPKKNLSDLWPGVDSFLDQLDYGNETNATWVDGNGMEQREPVLNLRTSVISVATPTSSSPAGPGKRTLARVHGRAHGHDQLPAGAIAMCIIAGLLLALTLTAALHLWVKRRQKRHVRSQKSFCRWKDDTATLTLSSEDQTLNEKLRKWRELYSPTKSASYGFRMRPLGPQSQPPGRAGIREAGPREGKIYVPPPPGPTPFDIATHQMTAQERQYSIDCGDMEIVEPEAVARLPGATGACEHSEGDADEFVVLVESANTIIQASGNSLPPAHAAELSKSRATDRMANKSSRYNTAPHRKQQQASSSKATARTVGISQFPVANGVGQTTTTHHAPNPDMILGSTSYRSAGKSADSEHSGTPPPFSRDYRQSRRGNQHGGRYAAAAAAAAAGGDTVGSAGDPLQQHENMRTPGSSGGSAVSGGSSSDVEVPASEETLDLQATDNNRSHGGTPASSHSPSPRTRSPQERCSAYTGEAKLQADIAQNQARTRQLGSSKRRRLEKTDSVDMDTFIVLDQELVRHKDTVARLSAATNKQQWQKAPSLQIGSSFDTISPSAARTTQSHSPHGTIQFSVQYQLERQQLVVTVHRASNLPLDAERQPPHTIVKVEIRPPTTADTVSTLTRSFKPSRNPAFNEEVVFAEYSAAEISLCTLNLKVYRIASPGSKSGGGSGGVLQRTPTQTRLGVMRMKLRDCILMGTLQTFDKPLEVGRQKHRPA
ncbi:uncharacterized protein LOC135819759 [Sycon ciliatum]|uniref:uncharacterized protein LOC135819759 n=1 Tax=Sycon ciliatum TaxID=27933 RepID=UPI0031F6ACCB